MKRRMTLGALIVLGALGCANVTVKSSKPGTAAPVTQEYGYMFWGLVGTNEVDLAAVCPTGVAKIHQVATFGQMCIGACTLGIYDPRTVEITCASGTAYRMDVDVEGRVTALALLDGQGDKEVVR